MAAAFKTPVAERQILLVGPYGVLGTGVIDAVAENPKWGITTAARRPPPAYRAQAAPPHIRVDLMDRESTTNAFSSLDGVTDLVFAAHVEKPTMAETVEPNARMLKNTLDALAAASRAVATLRVRLSTGGRTIRSARSQSQASCSKTPGASCSSARASRNSSSSLRSP